MTIREGDNADTGVELTGYTSKSPELTVTQIPSSTVTSTGPSTTFQGNEYEPAPSDEKNRIPSAFIPEGSYDTLAPADEPPVPSAQVIPPAQNGQSNPSAPKVCVCLSVCLSVSVYVHTHVCMCMYVRDAA